MDAPRPEPCILHRAEAVDEQPLGHLPLSGGDEHLCAAGITEAEHGDVLVLGEPPLDNLAPLLDPLPVGGVLAGRYPDADDVADRLQTADVAAGRGSHRFVDLR